MLRNAGYADKEEIKQIWMKHFANYETAEVLHYFEHGYDEQETVVFANDTQVISTIHVKHQVLSLMQQKLEVSYLLGVATIPDYRRCDFMKDLMHHVLDEESHQHLVTLIDADFVL